MIKAWWRRVRPSIASWPVATIVRLLGMSVKLRTEGYEQITSRPGSKIYSGWHGRTLLGTKLFRNRGFWTIVSHSRDGEMQSRILSRFGFQLIRGSSGRGGIKALRECIRVLHGSEAELAFTPDGPRGPTGVVQEGIVLIAQKSGAAMVPVGSSARRRWLVRSWDRFMIPKPFSECIMVFGEPIYVAEDATKEELDAARLLLQERMHAAEATAEAAMGHRVPSADVELPTD